MSMLESKVQMSAEISKAKLLRGKLVSEVYQDYLEPLLLEYVNHKPRPSLEKLNKVSELAWTIWNAVVFADNSPNVLDIKVLQEIESTSKEDAEINQLVQMFVNRKREKFGEFRYLFGHCEFYFNPDGEIRCRAEARLPDWK